MDITIGFVNFYDPVKGFGFIRREKGRDLIFSHSDIVNNLDVIDLPKGTKVSFNIVKTPKGHRAIDISLI
ncbi:retron Se72 family effector protein [Edwardsiella sp. A.80236]|uniref:retron Se72 family effector protein n=1 Tax=Edwardsiella sp. A.80236 TaxID=3318355 RepID=UPI00296C5505|nr:cold shock domain-containing protein [Escherichia coli]